MNLNNLPAPEVFERAFGKAVGAVVWRLCFILAVFAFLGVIAFGAVEGFIAIKPHLFGEPAERGVSMPPVEAVSPANQQAKPAPTPDTAPSISWNGRLLIYSAPLQSGRSPTQPYGIGYVDFRGDVIGKKAVQLKEAYLLSGLTGEKRSFVINSRWGFQDAQKFPLDQINPLPSGTKIELMIPWNPPISVSDFYNQWGKSTLVIKYGDMSYTKEISEDMMKSYLTSDIVGADLVLGVPHVTPKTGK